MQILLSNALPSENPEVFKKKWVQKYTDAGFVLFPCGAGPKLKAPLRKGWQETPYNPNLTANDLPDIYGVVIPKEVIVLDYDPRRDPEQNQLSNLWRNLGLEQTKTFIVKTGSGGYHIYFRKPTDIYKKSSIPGYPAIDLKFWGGYVIAAGSKHFSGNYYTVECGDIDCLSACPQTLLDAIPDVIRSTRTADLEYHDDTTLNHAIQYLVSTKPAVEGSGGDQQTYSTACQLKNYGLPQALAYELMLEHYNSRCSPPWEPNRLQQKVQNAYAYSQESQGSRNPKTIVAGVETSTEYEPDESLAKEINKRIHWSLNHNKAGIQTFAPTLNNVIGFLSIVPTRTYPNPLYKLFRLNMFAGQIEFAHPAPWHDPDYHQAFLTDTDIIKLKEYLTHKHLFVRTELVREGVIAVAHENQYHPLRNWLNGLLWDGIPRLDDMLIRYAGTADSAYTRAVSKCTLIAAVARVLRPGCKHDHMLILEGNQGIGKTEFVKTLGGEWYADIKIDPSDKDTIQAMQGTWILEASEMEFLKRSDMGALKRFLTVTRDKIRLPYAHCPSLLPRQSIFIGTVNPNPDGYFRDTTGNRRFWPVVCRKFDLQALKRDREQLFAEAVTRYKNGEVWYLDQSEIEAVATAEQGQRMETDSWEDTIKHWLAGGNLPAPLTTDIVAHYALNLPVGRMGQTEKRRLCNAMRSASYESTSTWDRTTKAHIRVWRKVGGKAN